MATVVTHSLWGCQSMMYGKTVIGHKVSEQTWQGMTRMLKGRPMT